METTSIPLTKVQEFGDGEKVILSIWLSHMLMDNSLTREVPSNPIATTVRETLKLLKRVYTPDVTEKNSNSLWPEYAVGLK